MAESSYSSSVTTSGSQQERPTSEVLNEKFDAFKKFATTSFTRAKQFTVEKLGRADSVTAYDAEFEDLSQRIDQIKYTTERILQNVEAMIQPNPSIRLETIVYSKLERQQPYRSSTYELLGVELTRAGNEYGPETMYGGYLTRCGQVENQIGASEKRFKEKAQTEFITPLKAFLEVDIKNVLRERRALLAKRLDLDSCKSQVKKASPEKMPQLEKYLHDVQADYDMMLDKVRANLKKIVDTHTNNLGHLRDLMAATRAFHQECLVHLQDVETEASLSHTPISSVSASSTKGSLPLEVDGVHLSHEDARKARVLYDFDAERDDQMSVTSDQIIVVYSIEDDDDYMMAHIGDKFGKVPLTYMEML